MKESNAIIDYIGKDILKIELANKEFYSNHKRLKKIGKNLKKSIKLITRQKELLDVYFKYFERIEFLCGKTGINPNKIFDKVNLKPLQSLKELIEKIQADARAGNYKDLDDFYAQEESYLEDFENQNNIVNSVKTSYKPHFWSKREPLVRIAVLVLILLANYATPIYSSPNAIAKADSVKVLKDFNRFQYLPEHIKEHEDLKRLTYHHERLMKLEEKGIIKINEWHLEDNHHLHTFKFIQGWHYDHFDYSVMPFGQSEKRYRVNIPEDRLFLIIDLDGRGSWQIIVFRYSYKIKDRWVIVYFTSLTPNKEFNNIIDAQDKQPINEWY